MRLFRKSRDRTEHGYVEERLSAYLDGELSPQERAAVDQHLASCPACRWSFETLQQTVQWTRELPPLPVPRAFTVPVAPRRVRAPRRRWTLTPVLQGATALVALLLVFVAAGDVLLSGFLSAPAEPQAVVLEAPAPVEKEGERVMVTAAVEMEKAAAEEAQPPADAAAGGARPSPLAKELPAVEPLPTEVAEAMPLAGTPGAGEVGGVAGEPELPAQTDAVAESMAEPTMAVTLTHRYTLSAAGPRPSKVLTSEEVVLPTAVALATVPKEPTVAPLPTAAPAIAPTATPPPLVVTAAPSPAPTTIAEVREPAPAFAADEEGQSTRQRTESPLGWLRAVEIALAAILVLLAVLTIAAMLARRRT